MEQGAGYPFPISAKSKFYSENCTVDLPQTCRGMWTDQCSYPRYIWPYLSHLTSPERMMQNVAAAVAALNQQATFLRLKRQLDGQLSRDRPNVPLARWCRLTPYPNQTGSQSQS